MSKITAYTATGTVHTDDLLLAVDVHDTSMAATGTDKKITVAQLGAGLSALGAVTSVGAVAVSGTPSAGQMLTATGPAAADWETLYVSSAAAEPLNSGESILPRFLSSMGPFTLTDHDVNLTYWVASTSGTCTGVTTYSAGTAAAGSVYMTIGVYSVAPVTGNLTLLASTANVAGTNWLAANTAYTNSWSGSFARTAGTCYALAIASFGSVMPQIQGYTGIPALLGLASPAAPRVTGRMGFTYVSVAAGSNGGTITNIASWANPSAGVLAVTNPQAAGFPSSGTFILAFSVAGTYAVINYTGTTTTTFTGCTYVSGGTGTVSTGFAVYGVLPATVPGGNVAAQGYASAAVVAP